MRSWELRAGGLLHTPSFSPCNILSFLLFAAMVSGVWGFSTAPIITFGRQSQLTSQESHRPNRTPLLASSSNSEADVTDQSTRFTKADTLPLKPAAVRESSKARGLRRVASILAAGVIGVGSPQVPQGQGQQDAFGGWSSTVPAMVLATVQAPEVQVVPEAQNAESEEATANRIWHENKHEEINTAENNKDFRKVMKVMSEKECRTSPVIQEHCCWALGRLSFSDEKVRVKIASAKGIDKIVEAMSMYQEEAGVQQHGAGALCALSGGQGKDADNIRVRIVSQGGLDAVIKGMKMHESDPLMQIDGCGALMNLARGAQFMDIREKISTAGGIEAVTEALMRHQAEPAIQIQGSATLMNLAHSEQNQRRIASAGGIDAVVNGMKANEANAGVQESGLGSLLMLSHSNQENIVKTASAGGIETIVMAMKNHKDLAQVQQAGCDTLSSLGYMQDSIRVRIAAAGGIEAVVQAMKGHQSNPEIQIHGSWALMNICAGNADNKAKIAKCGGVTAVREAMSNFPSNQDVQQQGAFALSNIGQEE